MQIPSSFHKLTCQSIVLNNILQCQHFGKSLRFITIKTKPRKKNEDLKSITLWMHRF